MTLKKCAAQVFLFVIVGSLALVSVEGHGMLLEPVGRSSRWRYDGSAPVNYDDNALYCGGYYKQWEVNGGKCGICGDDYSSSTPRPNELGGKFGSGVIVSTYQAGSTISVGAQLTASHLGYFFFEICNLDAAGSESESCFQPLSLGNGASKYPITSYASAYYETTVELPAGVSCNHCVLRWTYVAGNNWGICDNGTGALGCGPQETFKSCSDIEIISTRNAYEEVDLVDDIPEEDFV